MRQAAGEGHFVYALSVGEYATSIGIAQAVTQGIGQKFERACPKFDG